MERSRGWLTILVVALGMSSFAHAQSSTTAAVWLEKAIQRELVDGDLPGAIETFEQILTRFGDDRSIAPRALWHLAQCYEQLGDPRARQTYERLLREYADDVLASRARTRLQSLLGDDTESGPAEVQVREVWSQPAPFTPTGQQQVIFSDLAVFNRQTGETRRLTSGARSTAYPVVSPDLQYVAYLSWSGDLKERLGNASSDRALPREGAELRMVRLDGNGDRVLLPSGAVPWLRPFAWSPDGKQILTVVERRNRSREIALVGVEDGSLRALTSLPWLSPQGMGFSPDGHFIAYEVASPRNSRQLDFFILPVDQGARGLAVERRYSLALGQQRSASAPSQEQLAIHTLNRLSFGPRPGDIERVKSMGLDAYIEEQLHPERIADPVVDAKLASFKTLRMSIPDLLEKTGPVVPEAARRRATIFERAELAERAGVVPPLFGATAADSTEARRLMLRDRPADYEVHTARILRALSSERQLFELMVDFWMNHFNVNLGDHQLTAHFEEQAIRRHTLGRFEDLLMAVSKHPRMLYYLDNWRSSAPADVVQKRVAALKASGDGPQVLALLERQPFLEANKGLNENFARELMELHTLGVDGGYTQQDVGEVAKVLTGWTISGQGIVNGREDDGAFVFDPLLHVDGDKTVLGRTIKAGGMDEGEQLLKMLAAHPSTARFISTKLARRFIADEPPAAVIDAAARTFQQTGGDIRQVLATILTSPQFRAVEAIQAKIKKPLELVVSSLRAGNAEIADYETYYRFANGNNNQGVLARMGERLYSYQAPDGNPDVGSAWMNSNALLARLDFANALATGRLQGVKINLRATQLLLEQLGLPRPTQSQIEQTRAMLQKSAAAAGASPGMQSSMMMAAGAAAASATAPVDPAALAVAAMLGSPQFQKR